MKKPLTVMIHVFVVVAKNIRNAALKLYLSYLKWLRRLLATFAQTSINSRYFPL
ncbi:hypothetical protein VAE122_3070044 [Vibrio aestuarianus]|nr:hypothetical protein VAE122_3070044 [Vibrio aestuarianus]